MGGQPTRPVLPLLAWSHAVLQFLLHVDRDSKYSYTHKLPFTNFPPLCGWTLCWGLSPQLADLHNWAGPLRCVAICVLISRVLTNIVDDRTTSLISVMVTVHTGCNLHIGWALHTKYLLMSFFFSQLTCIFQ